MFHHRAPSFPWCLNLGLAHWWLWQGPGCEALIRGSWDLVLPDPIPSIRNERFFGIYHGCAIKWTWMLSNQIDIYIYNYNSNYIYTVYIYMYAELYPHLLMVNDVNDCLRKAFASLVFLLLLRVKVSDPTTDILFTTSSQLSIIIVGWVLA